MPESTVQPTKILPVTSGRTWRARLRSIRLYALAGTCVALVLALLAGCGTDAPASGYRQDVLEDRMQRDMDMRSEGSVLTGEARNTFKGLRYFPVDSTYRMTAPLERSVPPDTVRMAQSTGGTAEHLRVGHVTLSFPEGPERLAVFRSLSAPSEPLWIPFADATNGQETYGGGRYVDVVLREDSLAVVDLNRAYNPTCAYNPAYACPLPPAENHLPFGVPAGEQRPLLETH